MLIIGVCGKAGSGKDTIADILVRDHGFVKVAFADPLKRVCQEIFEFTTEQLWGPSDKRNEPDFRYCRTPHQAGFDPVDGRPTSIDAEYLTPRYALQKLGTEWGRDCYPDIWVEYAMRIAKRLSVKGAPIFYDARFGIRSKTMSDPDEVKGVVISDVRFLNEVEGLKSRGAKVVRVYRNSVKGLAGQAGQHRSETEQETMPDELFDYVVQNNGSLEDLVTITHGFLSQFQIESRDEGFARMLEGIPGEGDSFTKYPMTGFELVKKQVSDLTASVKEEVDYEMALAPSVQVEGGEVIPANETPSQEHLRGLLQDRQRDVEAGKILPLDNEQKDIPPFKRRK